MRNGNVEKTAVSASNEREFSINRLAKIDGIAQKTAEAMYQIGIHGYADLAQYLSQHTTQQVSAALQEHGVNRPPAFINQETWVRQAREFSMRENTAPTPPEEEPEPVKKLEEAPSSRTGQEHNAVFTVSFDVARGDDREPVLHTTVHDGTNGGREGVFQGEDTAPWVNWMLERANLPVAVEHIATQTGVLGDRLPIKTEAAAPPIPVELDGTRLEIGDVRLSIVRPTLRVPEKRLKAEISFQLSGADAETLAAKGIPFRIEEYTVDIASGVSELVASDRSQLEPQVLQYKSEQEFDIPDVGRYEFHSIVFLLPPGNVAAYYRGPTIRVVP
jgi:hypothetical protein